MTIALYLRLYCFLAVEFVAPSGGHLHLRPVKIAALSAVLN